MAGFPYKIINGALYLGADNAVKIERADHGGSDDIKFTSEVCPGGVWLSDLEAAGLRAMYLRIEAGPDAEATAEGEWGWKIPLPSLASGAVTFTSLAVQADIYVGNIITGDTTIRLSNGVMGAEGADVLDVSLTDTGGDTDRYNSGSGSVPVDLETGTLYVHLAAAGGHGEVHVWIGF